MEGIKRDNFLLKKLAAKRARRKLVTKKERIGEKIKKEIVPRKQWNPCKLSSIP